MSEIFISYAREDLRHAKTLAAAFEKFGWSVFWDKEIPAGKVFDEVIEEKLKDVKCVIVIWTQNSVSSRWVKVEAGEGASRNILVPVLFEDVSIPLAFRNIQAANLTDWDGINHTTSFHDLTQDISSLIGKPAQDKQAEQKQEKEAQVRAEEEERLKLEADSRWKTETENRIRKEMETSFPSRPVNQPEIDPAPGINTINRSPSNKKKWVIISLGLFVVISAALITWKMKDLPNVASATIVNKKDADEAIRVDDSIWNETRSINDTNKYKTFIEFRPNSKHAAQAQSLLDSFRNETRKKMDILLSEKTVAQRKAALDSVNIRAVDVSESLTVKEKIATLKDSSGWKNTNLRLYDSILGKYTTINETQASLRDPASDFVTSTGQSENRRPTGVTKQFRISGGAALVTVFAVIDAHNGGENLTVSLNPPNASPSEKTFNVSRSDRYPTWRQFSVTQPGDYVLTLKNRNGNLIGRINFNVTGR